MTGVESAVTTEGRHRFFGPMKAAPRGIPLAARTPKPGAACRLLNPPLPLKYEFRIMLKSDFHHFKEYGRMARESKFE